MVHVRYLYDRICDIHQHDTVSTVPQVNKKSTAFKDEDPFTARAPGWRQIAPNCPSSNRSSDDKSLDLGCYPFFSIKFKDKAFQLQDVAGYIFPKSIHAVLYIYICMMYLCITLLYTCIHTLRIITWQCAEITIFFGSLHFQQVSSMDWCKGKSTGNFMKFPMKYEVPRYFPLNPPIEFNSSIAFP